MLCCAVLCCAFIIQNIGNLYSYQIKQFATFDIPFGDAAVSALVDVQDVAEVMAKAVFLEGDQIPSSYSVRGSEAVSHSKIAQVISEVTGNPVQYRNVSEEQAKEYYLK